jgi:hypothetical protein
MFSANPARLVVETLLLFGDFEETAGRFTMRPGNDPILQFYWRLWNAGS